MCVTSFMAGLCRTKTRMQLILTLRQPRCEGSSVRRAPATSGEQRGDDFALPEDRDGTPAEDDDLLLCRNPRALEKGRGDVVGRTRFGGGQHAVGGRGAVDVALLK